MPSGSCGMHDSFRKELDEKISKSSVKWMATLFALPALIAVLATYSFITNAEYKFGSAVQAQHNLANIKMLDERTLSLKGDMMKFQADLSLDLASIKSDLKEIAKELRNHNLDTKGNKP